MKTSQHLGPGPGLALCLALLSPTALAGAPAQVDWDRSEDALVLRYEERSDKLEGVEAITLELWGDGRVVVARPAPHANAGVFEARLKPGEVQALLSRIALPAVVAFDAQRVQADKRELARLRAVEAAASGGRPKLVYRSERERIVLELQLSKYRAEPRAPLARVDQRIEWRGLRLDRDEFPEHFALAELAAAVGESRALLAQVISGE